jgi:hypothetical protein
MAVLCRKALLQHLPLALTQVDGILGTQAGSADLQGVAIRILDEPAVFGIGEPLIAPALQLVLYPFCVPIRDLEPDVIDSRSRVANAERAPSANPPMTPLSVR